jgi:hypothetical protein
MRFRKCFGYGAYPLLAVLFSVPSAMRGQDPTPQQPATTPQSQTDQDQTQPQQTMDQSQSTQQQRAEVLRQAQIRVNARRKLRIQQIIQDTYSHKFEFDFGGGALRFRPGSTLQHNNEAGWQVDITDYLRGNLGVTVESRGYYGVAYTGTNPYSVYNPSISQYSFLAGPRYRFYRGQHWGWTGQVEAGVGHGNFGTGTNSLPPQYVHLWSDATVFNASIGASLDYNLGPGLAIRLTPNYLITNYGSTMEYNPGGNLGVVYRFGRK